MRKIESQERNSDLASNQLSNYSNVKYENRRTLTQVKGLSGQSKCLGIFSASMHCGRLFFHVREENFHSRL